MPYDERDNIRNRIEKIKELESKNKELKAEVEKKNVLIEGFQARIRELENDAIG